MSEIRNSVFRRYYDLVAWVLSLIIAVDLAIIVYRKLSPTDIRVSRIKRNDFPLHVDPNTADSYDLQCLPGINPKLAKSIIDYRVEYQRRFPDRTVFAGPEDLRRVKGISEKKLLQIIPHLAFPKSKPQTQPSLR